MSHTRITHNRKVSVPHASSLAEADTSQLSINRFAPGDHFESAKQINLQQH